MNIRGTMILKFDRVGGPRDEGEDLDCHAGVGVLGFARRRVGR